MVVSNRKDQVNLVSIRIKITIFCKPVQVKIYSVPKTPNKILVEYIHENLFIILNN